jgi:hypothetical protein
MITSIAWSINHKKKIQNNIIKEKENKTCATVDSLGKLPYLEFKMNGESCKFLIDTGSPASILSGKYRGLVTGSGDSSFMAVNGSPINVFGKTIQVISNGEMLVTHEFFVADVTLNLLGNDFFIKNKVNIDYGSENVSIGGYNTPLYPTIPHLTYSTIACKGSTSSRREIERYLSRTPINYCAFPDEYIGVNKGRRPRLNVTTLHCVMPEPQALNTGVCNISSLPPDGGIGEVKNLYNCPPCFGDRKCNAHLLGNYKNLCLDKATQWDNIESSTPEPKAPCRRF